MRIVFRIFPILLLIAACKSPTSTENAGPSTNSSPGDFRFKLNGTTFDRADYALGSSAYASLTPNSGQGVPAHSKLLAIQLTIFRISGSAFHSTTVELYAPMVRYGPQTFHITKWDDPVNAQAGILLDSNQFLSEDGGTLTIDKLDTVNNLVSGSFSFTCSQKDDPSQTRTAEGAFSNVGIYLGGFGQGSVIASVEGIPFITVPSDLPRLSAYIVAGSKQLTILAFDTAAIQKELMITIDNPGVGTFALGGGNATVVLSYATYGAATDVSVSSDNDGMGQLVITSYNSATRRVTGTFKFTGSDKTTGQAVHITGGVIDNVQWSVL